MNSDIVTSQCLLCNFDKKKKNLCTTIVYPIFASVTVASFQFLTRIKNYYLLAFCFPITFLSQRNKHLFYNFAYGIIINKNNSLNILPEKRLRELNNIYKRYLSQSRHFRYCVYRSLHVTNQMFVFFVIVFSRLYL